MGSERLPEIEVIIGDPGTDDHRPANQFDGRGKLTSLSCDHAQKVAGVGMVRADLQDLPIQTLGLFQTPG